MNRILTLLASIIRIVVGGGFLLTGIPDIIGGEFPGWIEGIAGICILLAGFALLMSEFDPRGTGNWALECAIPNC